MSLMNKRLQLLIILNKIQSQKKESCKSVFHTLKAFAEIIVPEISIFKS